MKHLCRFFVFLLIIGGYYPAHAQLQGQALIDSLLRRLPNVTDDKQKLKLLDSLSFEYKAIDPALGIKYGMQQLELAKQLDETKEEAHANYKIAINYRYKGDYINAAAYGIASLKIFEALNDTLGSASALSDLSIIYEAQGNYQKALEYDLRSLKINESQHDTLAIAGDLGNIGNVYMNLQDYNKALEYGFKSLALYERKGDKAGIANNLGNIGNAYFSLNDVPRSLEYDTKAVDIFSELGDKSGLANTFSSIANIYTIQHIYATALQYDFKALRLSEEMGDQGGIGNVFGNIGAIYLTIAKDTPGTIPADTLIPMGRIANLNMALEYFKKALVICKEVGQADNIIEFTNGISETWELLGNYKEALASYEQFAITKDSVFSNVSKIQIAGLEKEREIEIKDKQIQIEQLEVAKKRNERIILIIGIVLLAVIIVIVLRMINRQIKKNALLSKEKEDNLEHIQTQSDVLTGIAYKQSHEVRAPIATIIGLIQLYNFDDVSDPMNKEVIEGVTDVVGTLDVVIAQVVEIENTLLSNVDKK